MNINTDFLEKVLNNDDLSILKSLFNGSVSYDHIKETLESVYANEKMFNITVEDILQVKTNFLNVLMLKAQPFSELKLDPMDHTNIQNNSPNLKLSHSYARQNKFINLSYYLTMEPIKRCFVASEQANMTLFNPNLGKMETNGLRETVLSALTINSQAPVPQFYNWTWNKTTILDLIIYDSFFLKPSMLLWDFDITLNNFYRRLQNENYIINKFYFHSFTSRLYYITTSKNVYFISNLYEFMHLLTSLSNKRKR